MNSLSLAVVAAAMIVLPSIASTDSFTLSAPPEPITLSARGTRSGNTLIIGEAY